MQEDVDQSRVFDLRGEAELGLIVAHLAPAVALPIGVLPLPVTSVVLGHLLGLAVASSGRHNPLGHGLVDHRNRDCEVGVLVVFVRDIRATVFKDDFRVTRHADELGPSGRVGGVERRKLRVERGVGVEADRVDVIPEGVVSDDAVDTKLEAGKAAIEVGVRIPVTVVALGLEVESTANAGIGDNDVEKRHAGRFGKIEAEGVVFVLEFDKSVIEHVEAEVGDLVEIGHGHFDTDGAKVVTSTVEDVVLGDEPALVVEEAAVGAVVVDNAKPLVTSATDVVRAKELFVDVLGDAGVGLFELKDLFGGEEAIEKALHANPFGVHLFAEKLESVGLGAGALNDLRVGGAGVGVAIGVVDLLERGAGIIEPTTKAESFLLGGVVQGPCLLVEAGEVSRVGDEFLHIKVVEILTALTEKAVNLLAGIKEYL